MTVSAGIGAGTSSLRLQTSINAMKIETLQKANPERVVTDADVDNVTTIIDCLRGKGGFAAHLKNPAFGDYVTATMDGEFYREKLTIEGARYLDPLTVYTPVTSDRDKAGTVGVKLATDAGGLDAAMGWSVPGYDMVRSCRDGLVSCTNGCFRSYFGEDSKIISYKLDTRHPNSKRGVWYWTPSKSDRWRHLFFEVFQPCWTVDLLNDLPRRDMTQLDAIACRPSTPRHKRSNK